MPLLKGFGGFLNRNGRNIARYLYSGLKMGGPAIVVLVLVGIGQVAQYAYSVNDLRTKTILDWTTANPGKVEQTNAFVEKCLNGKVAHSEDIVAPVSLYDCGVGVGAAELTDRVRASDQALKNVAWPLSLLE